MDHGKLKSLSCFVRVGGLSPFLYSRYILKITLECGIKCIIYLVTAHGKKKVE